MKVYSIDGRTGRLRRMTKSAGQPAKPFRATHLTPEEVTALFERLARYRRRREAAERGEDWQLVQ